MNQASIRMGYPGIAARIADEHPIAATPRPAAWPRLTDEQQAARRALDVPAVDPDGWIEWAGGDSDKPPFSASIIPVDVRLRNGVEKSNQRAADLRWDHMSPGHPYSSTDIVAYRITKWIAKWIATALVAKAIKETPKPDPDEWLEWHGGERPVPKDMRIEFKTRGGSSGPLLCYPGNVRWTHENKAGDIVAYRIVKVTLKPDPDEWLEWAGGDGDSDESPFPDSTIVDIRLRRGVEKPNRRAADLRWDHRLLSDPYSRSDIVAYRIVKD